MNSTEEIEQSHDDKEMLDDYGHLPFKRAGNRFAKYRNAQAYVIDDNGERYNVEEHEEKVATPHVD